jgi:type I restriction enzyme S subunit
MARDDKRLLTPRLRFPEFRKEEGWEVRPIGDYLIESRIPGSNGRLAKKLTVKLWGKGVTEKAEALRGSENTRYYCRSAGQFIYSKLDFLNQAFGIVPASLDGYESTVDLPCFDVADSLNSKFLLEYVQRDCFYKKNGELADGGRRAKRIQVESFLSFPIAIPAIITEQQKIADCLTSLDELIAAQGRRVGTLKAHKKGLMQQLFPREGETLPRLRFPEFRDDLEWREVEFGKLLQINSGKGFKASEYSSSGIRLIQIENVGYGEVKWGDNTVYLPDSYSDEYPELVLRKGDVVLALNRPITNGELKIAQLRKCDEPSLLYQRVGKLVRTSDLIADTYVLQLCKTFVKDFVLKKSIGSDQPFISLRELYDQIVVIPAPAEQQRIAACLSELDARLAAEVEKLAALKTHKTGLMQQLFPTPEED